MLPLLTTAHHTQHHSPYSTPLTNTHQHSPTFTNIHQHPPTLTNTHQHSPPLTTLTTTHQHFHQTARMGCCSSKSQLAREELTFCPQVCAISITPQSTIRKPASTKAPSVASSHGRGTFTPGKGAKKRLPPGVKNWRYVWTSLWRSSEYGYVSTSIPLFMLSLTNMLSRKPSETWQ